MIFRPKPKKAVSTPMSDFIRNASSEEKNKVYKRVLIKASERQQDLIKRAALVKRGVSC